MNTIGVAAGVVLLNQQGEIFLMKRSSNTRNDHGMWSIPGGRIEFGEKAADAAKRETKEECDIDVLKIKQLGYIDHILPEYRQHWIPQIFLAEQWSGTPKNLEPQKCDDIGWYSMEKLPEKCSQVVIDAVELLKCST